MTDKNSKNRKKEWYDNHKNIPEFKEAQRIRNQVNKENYIKKYGIESWNERNRKRQNKYVRIHKEEVTKREKEWREKLRIEVLTHYGGSPPKCICCGETESKFLSIDHVNGGGNKHRKQIGSHIYNWIKNNDFPKGFQVLCYNCNLAKGFYGICPHKEDKN